MKTPQKPDISSGPRRRLPPAAWAFIFALLLSALLLFFSLSSYASPLTPLAGLARLGQAYGFSSLPSALCPWLLFVLLCFAAPFFPGWQFFLPTVTHGPRDRNRVSLSFDDGPDEDTTPALLALLDKHEVKAAFFVVGSKAARHPELLAAILARGHELGNHSQNHDVFLMLRTSARLQREIEGCGQALEQSGVRALAFRPPAGIVNPRLKSVLEELGMFCVGFSVRGGDWGNRKIRGLSERILRRIRPGDIVLLHDCRPATGREIPEWLGEVEAVITGLKRQKIELVKLSDLLGREIMIIPRQQGK
ncbi:MAG: polysaccharide deacetylase family protein [Proteobacteria bacterium]|nr:polysaccharide deacetylase family protein [Pseudomonadota bacterium]